METELSPRRVGIDSFWLKVIAITGMTLDHAGIVFGQYLPLWAESALYAFGGLTFPIMAFLLCEGYRHTRNVKKYMLRLLVFALIAQIPYMWALMTQLNVLFTLLLGLIAIHVTKKIKNGVAVVLVGIAFSAVTVVFDWGLVGVPMVLMYYYIENKWRKVVFPILIAGLLVGIPSALSVFVGEWSMLPNLLYFCVGCVLTIPLLAHYNGERGRSMRYFFYAYYPLHIAALGLLRGLIMGNWGSIF